MMIKYYLSLSILLSTSVFAQVPVGQYIDHQGIPIDGFLDIPEFVAGGGIKTHINSTEYEKGYYYTEEGVRVDGFIKFETTFFRFKKDKNDKKREILNPDVISSLMVGQDSFYLASNFAAERGLLSNKIGGKKQHFVQHFDSFDGKDYAVYYHFGQNAITKTYLIREKETGKWTSSVTQGKTSADFVMDNFSHVPFIKEQDHEWTQNEIPSVIKMAKYYHLYQKDGTIYFDRWWNETGPGNEVYTAKVASVDSLWTISYFQDDVKFNESQYSNMDPNKREGYSRWYYNDGKLRKETIYEDNKALEATTYFPNGLKHYWYGFDYSLYDNKFRGIKFLMVYNLEGQSLLDNYGTGQEVLNDSLNNRTITRSFQNGSLAASSFEKDGRRTYQWVGSLYNFKRVQKKWRFYRNEQEFDHSNTVAVNANGFGLLALNIGADKACRDYQVINKLHDDFDDYIAQFLSDKILASAAYPIRFKPYKVNSEKVAYEVLLPISFSANKFYRQPNYYTPYYYHDPFLHQQPPIKITPPPMPRGF